MHPESLAAIKRGLDQWVRPADLLGKPQCLDVGSFDVNGNFRDLVQSYGLDYVGLDIVEGKNVDVVMDDPYHFPFHRESFDVVISGSTMEHVPAIWLWIFELTRMLKPGGLLVLHTHMAWVYHPHPVDCWRIMPDGMKYLFDMTGQLERYTIEQIRTTRYTCLATDILGVAWKRVQHENS